MVIVYPFVPVTLINAITAVAVLTAATFWTLLKLTKWSIAEDNNSILGLWERISTLFRVVLAVMLLLEFGGGIGDWMYDAYYVVTGLL